MRKKFQFGKINSDFKIPLLNNQVIKTATGIMFISAFIALISILFKGNFIPVKYILYLFVLEFSIRLIINLKFAPILIIRRIKVFKQNSEYVRATQKKFVWYVGFSISVIMFLLLVVLNTNSSINWIACLICLILMFFEYSFGICVGHKIFYFLKKENA